MDKIAENMAQNAEFQAIFKAFLQEKSFTQTIALFRSACRHLDVSDASDNRTIYDAFRNATRNVTELWSFLDKVVANEVYGGGQICKNKQVSWLM